jgi:hypothetical protein
VWENNDYKFRAYLFQRPVAGLNRYSVTKSTGSTTMGKIITRVSNFFFVFGDLVGNNGLNQSLEGLEKISAVGRDIRTPMVMIEAQFLVSEFFVCDTWTMALVSKANPGF